MKIVGRDEFLKMPAGTVFSKYTLCNFGDVSIKGETIWFDDTQDAAHDFYYQQIADSVDCDVFTDTMCDYAPGQVLVMDFDCESRDGFFDKDEKYAVWSRDDSMKLIARLARAVADSDRL